MGTRRGAVLVGGYRVCSQGAGVLSMATSYRSGTCSSLGGEERYERDTLNYECPAVVFYVEEDKDLEGWVKEYS